MKTHLLKRSLFCLIAAFISSNFLCLVGQDAEVLQGTNMEKADTAYWTFDVLSDEASEDEVVYEFGYTEASCTECTDGVLHISSKGSMYVNAIFYQEVTLKANTVYKTDASFKDLTGELDNFWCQLKLSLDGNPPEGENDAVKLAGFNTWLGCGQYTDGTFMNDACDAHDSLIVYNENDEFAGFRGYTTPDSLGETFTAYFAIVIGMWTNEETGAIPYDVVLDNVTLYDSVAAAGGSTALDPTYFNNDVALMNYPNPFSQQTTISYSLTERSNVKLSVYNLLGEEILCLYEGIRDAGTYEAVLDASNLDSSVLFCRLEYNNKVVTRKMTLVK